MHFTYISATLGILIAMACAWYCGRLATDKKRNVLLWTLFGFVLSVVAVPILVLLPDSRGTGDPRDTAGGPRVGDALVGEMREADVDDAPPPSLDQESPVDGPA